MHHVTRRFNNLSATRAPRQPPFTPAEPYARRTADSDDRSARDPRPSVDEATNRRVLGMCGIGGAIHMRGEPIPDLSRVLSVMSHLLEHRGPDDARTWIHQRGHTGFAHRRLSIIDLECGQQPMCDEAGRFITYNGEVYNYSELRTEIGSRRFRTTSDTEVVLRAYDIWGT